MKRSSKMLLTTAATVILSAVGLIIGLTRQAREQVFEKKREEQELQVLEGEGGICAS